jgi:hypothetical protein
MGTDVGLYVMWNSIEGMGIIAFQNEPDRGSTSGKVFLSMNRQVSILSEITKIIILNESCAIYSDPDGLPSFDAPYKPHMSVTHPRKLDKSQLRRAGNNCDRPER